MSFAAAYLVVALAVAVAASLRWPMVGVCSFLAIDFLRPQDLHFVLGELRPVVWLAAATALGSLLRRPRSGWGGLPRTLAPLAAVLAAAALSAATSDLPAASWSAWAELAKTTIVVALIVVHVDSPRRLEAALWTVAGAVGVIALAAIAKGLALGYPHAFRISVGGLGGPDGIDDAGPMRDNNAFARVLVFTLPLWFALFLRARSAWARVAAVAGGMATLFAFMLTFSRGGLVAATAIAVLGLLQMRPRWIAIAVVIGAIAVGYPLTPKIWRDRMAGTTLQDRSLQLRLETWREGLRMAEERPLLGVGIGAFTATYARDMPPPPRSAHNVFVEVLAEMGIVGLAAYGWLLGTALWPLWRLSTAGGAEGAWRPLARGLLIGTIGYLVASTALSHAFTSHLMTALALSLAATRAARLVSAAAAAASAPAAPGLPIEAAG